MHARRALGLVVLTLLVPFVSACGGGDGPSPSPQVTEGGPVQFVGDPAFEQTSGIRTEAGSRVVFGGATLRNTGAEPATLTEASLNGRVPQDAAALSEARVVALDGPSDLIGAAQWPFEDFARKSKPLEGFVVEAGQEFELLLIVEVKQTGRWMWPTSTVAYETGQSRFAAPVAFGSLVCPLSDSDCTVTN